MRVPLIPLPIFAAVVALLVLPAAAEADFQTLYDDYRNDGAINGCAYSSSDLTAGLSSIPADVREYDPGFAEALNSALEQLAAGCNPTSDSFSDQAGATTADGSPAPPSPKPLRFTEEGEAGPPAVLLGMMLLLAASLATAGLLAASRYYGWHLERPIGTFSRVGRGARDRLADGLWAVRDRLGF
jgi:hypothetical protein